MCVCIGVVVVAVAVLCIGKIHVVSAAETFLPLIVADAMRPDLTPEEEKREEKEGKVRAYSSAWA